MSIAKRILDNTLYGALGRFWLIGVNLFLTPLILSYLGDERFALWALFWALAAYFMLMDLGLGVAVVRQVARLHEASDLSAMNRVMMTAIIVTLALGFCCWGLTYLLFLALQNSLNFTSVHNHDVLNLIQWGFPILILISLTRIYDAFLRGLQRFDLITAVTFAVSCVNVLTVYLALEWQGEIRGLLIANVLTYAVQLLSLLYVAKRCEQGLSLWPGYFSWSTLKELFPLGARVQVAKIAELASYQSDKLILAYFLPLSFVTFYDLGSKIASVMRDATYVFTTALFPVAAQMQARGEDGQVWYLYERGSKYLLMFTVPSLALLLITAPMLIATWLGHVSEFVLQAVLILAVAYWVVVNMSMAFNVGTALNWSRPIMRGAILQTILNITLSIIFISQWGFMGALVATLIAISISKLYVIRSFYRDFQRALLPDVMLFFRVIMVNLPAIVPAMLLSLWLQGHIDPGSRLESLLGFTGVAVLYLALYLLSIRWMHLFDQYDFQLLNKHIPRVGLLIHRRYQQ